MSNRTKRHQGATVPFTSFLRRKAVYSVGANPGKCFTCSRFADGVVAFDSAGRDDISELCKQT